MRQAGIVVFIGKPGLQPFSDNRLGSADQHHAATVGQRQRKGEINFAVPILQGRLPAAHDKKASVPNKANIFSCPLSTSLPKTPDENPLKNCLCRYQTKSANRAMFATDKAVSWFNLSRFSQNSHHFNGFPRLFFIFRRPHMQRPSESLIFRHRDETEWGREFCLNHRHRNQSPVPFRSISICATARNVRPKLYPGRRGGFRRAGGIRPRPR